MSRDVILKALEHAQRDGLTLEQTADKIMAFLEIADVLGHGAATPSPVDGGRVFGPPPPPSTPIVTFPTAIRGAAVDGTIVTRISPQQAPDEPEMELTTGTAVFRGPQIVSVRSVPDEPEMELPTVDAAADPNQPKRQFQQIVEYVAANAPKTMEITFNGATTKIPLRMDTDAMSKMVRLTAMFGENEGPRAIFNVYEESLDLPRKVEEIQAQVLAQLQGQQEARPVASHFRYQNFGIAEKRIVVDADSYQGPTSSQFARTGSFNADLQRFVEEHGPIE